MTVIKYDRDLYRLEINGHCGAAPAGEDLVCAAITSQAIALTARCEDCMNYFASVYTNPNEGIVIVQCDPAKGQKQRCREMFDTVYAGLEKIAQFYPEYVKIGG